MNPSQSIGRNEPCPCGSGRKFKACCLEKNLAQPVSRSSARWVVLGFVGLLVAVAIGKAASDATSRNRAKNTPETATSAGAMPLAQTRPMSGTTPQPPGLAPPGKVWSPEHGHWHDAP